MDPTVMDRKQLIALASEAAALRARVQLQDRIIRVLTEKLRAALGTGRGRVPKGYTPGGRSWTVPHPEEGKSSKSVAAC